MPEPAKTLCKCGEALPFAKKGEVLICHHCQRKYRALGGGKVELAVDKNLVTKQEGDAEVFRFDSDDEEDGGDGDFDEKGSTIKIDLRERRRQAEKRRSAVTARATGQPIPESTSRPKPVRRKTDVPGGIVPMIVSIIVFNGLAFIALGLLFPTKDGITQTPWGSSFSKPSIPWLEMLALVLGHALGFGAWAIYVHQLHKKQKEKERAAREEAGDDDDDEEEKLKPAKSERIVRKRS